MVIDRSPERISLPVCLKWQDASRRCCGNWIGSSTMTNSTLLPTCGMETFEDGAFHHLFGLLAQGFQSLTETHRVGFRD